jgi:hypothetical protein
VVRSLAINAHVVPLIKMKARKISRISNMVNADNVRGQELERTYPKNRK